MSVSVALIQIQTIVILAKPSGRYDTRQAANKTTNESNVKWYINPFYGWEPVGGVILR